MEDSLASAGSRVGQAFADLDSLLGGISRALHEAINNEAQRFELWATNLGLYHSGHSSLDYRFRDAPLLYDFACKLLQDLERYLAIIARHIQEESSTAKPQSALEISTSSQGIRNLIDSSSKLEDGSDDSFSASDEDEGFDSFDTESVAEIALGNLTGVIDKLYRLSFKIRNPATRLGFSKAKHYRELDPDTGIDLIQQFEIVDQRHVNEVIASHRRVLPDECMDDFLVLRLAKANTFRRQQIKKWRHHGLKMKTTRTTEQHVRPVMERVPQTALLLSRNMSRANKVPSMPSTATHLQDIKPELDDASSQISTSTYAIVSQDVEGRETVIPKLPASIQNQSEFECPYCCTLCSKSRSIGRAWENHVMRDLRPYICTYEGCNEGDQLYDSFKQWANHEATSHGTSLKCADHTDIIFRSSLDYQDHMKNQHQRTFTPATNAIVTVQDHRQCPVCLKGDVDFKHVGVHLQQIALFSLPRSTGFEIQSEQQSGDSDRATQETRTLEEDALIAEDKMSDSIDRVFRHALQIVPQTAFLRPPLSDRLKLYGLYKQSTEGNVRDVMERPTVGVEAQKWDASSSYRSLSPTVAKRYYITHLIVTMKIYAKEIIEQHDLTAELESILDQVQPSPSPNSNSSGLGLTKDALRHVEASSQVGKVTEVDRYLRRINTDEPAAPQTESEIPFTEVELFTSQRVDSVNRDAEATLRLASDLGNKTIVQQLLAEGVDINASDGTRGTALQAASKQGHHAIVRLLLRHHADIDILGSVPSLPSALQLALSNGHEAVAWLLLDAGAEVNGVGGDLPTALQLAAAKGYTKVMQTLLDRGANISANDEGQGTAFQIASSQGDEAVVKLLFERGIDVNAYDSYGTGLQLASEQGHEAVVRLILQNGANVNAHVGWFLLSEDDNVQSATALHLASSRGHEAVVRLLLDFGADVNSNREGRSALQLALQNGHEAVAQLLLERGAATDADRGIDPTSQLSLRESTEEADDIDLSRRSSRSNKGMQENLQERKLKCRTCDGEHFTAECIHKEAIGGMEAAGLALAVIGTVDLCIKCGKELMRQYRALKCADDEVFKMLLKVESNWTRTEIHLDFIRNTSDSIPKNLKSHLGDVLQVLHNSLQAIKAKFNKLLRYKNRADDSQITKGSNSEMAKTSKLIFNIKLKEHMKSAAMAIEEWHRRLDPSWYLIGLIRNDKNDPINKDTRGMWYCCKCSTGPYPIGTMPHCLKCGHERCADTCQSRTLIQSQPPSSVATSATSDGSEEGLEEVTRCVCGNAEYPGLPEPTVRVSRDNDDVPERVAESTGEIFIQCDTCKVWQHGGCVGILSEEMCPEECFCELCHEELHQLNVDSKGYYQPPKPLVLSGMDIKLIQICGCSQTYSRYLPTKDEPVPPALPELAQDEPGTPGSRSSRAQKARASQVTAHQRLSYNDSQGAYDEPEMLRRAIEESKKKGDAGNLAEATGDAEQI